ncbi:hypothetical protein PSHT_06488 [Puccinia striiformis]|uniref:Uncharacterized protein n=1 Tax=Puccinia striiformis TaxID=27350 RepID=A0A2S4W5U3_9BASI|nr:hypothetical protein PSHT_06488 [Puccinia striiformis]
MATLGSVAAEDWKCPGDKPNKYCGHEQGTSEEPGGVCASTEPDHKCCNGNLPFSQFFTFGVSIGGSLFFDIPA